MMKRFVSAALTAAVVAGMTTSAFGATKLNSVTMFGGGDSFEPAYNQLKADFVKKNPSIEVVDTSDLASEAWKSSVLTDFATGNEPDVLFFFNGAPAKDILSKVVDVNTIKAKYPGYLKDTTASSLKSIAEADGKAYAGPMTGFTEVLYVNKDLFDQYKLQLPTTWDNLTKSIDTFKNHGVIPITIPLTEDPYYLFELLVMAYGGAAEHDVKPGTDFAKVPDSWVKALDTYKTFADMGAFGNMKSAATKKTMAARNEFITKKAAMIAEGSWINGTITKAGRGNQVTAMAMPTPPGGKGDGKSTLGGFSSGWYITKKAWNDPAKQKAAVDYVNFMLSKDSVRTMANAASATATAVNIALSGSAPNSTKTLVAVSGNAPSLCAPLNDQGSFNAAAWADLNTSFVKVARGQMTASDALKQAIAVNK